MQPIIDAHHHLWELGEDIRYPWLENAIDAHFFLGDYASIRKDFGIADLTQIIPKDYSLIASVHCEAEANREDALKEALWIDDLCQQQQVPCVQSVWVDLSAKNAADMLDYVSQIPSVRGIRWKPVVAQSAKENFDLKHKGIIGKNTLWDKTWQSALAVMEELGLIWELRVPAWDLSDAAACLLHYPKLKVVVNHCGLPWDRTEHGIKQWYDGMKLLAENKQVAVKLSELGSPNTPRDLGKDKQLLIQLLDLFGGKRCLFASNMPVSGIQVSYQDWVDTVSWAINHECPEYKEDIFWRNAVFWYDISLANIQSKII